MNVEHKIKELNDEVRAIKTAYAQAPFTLVLYTYDIGFAGELLVDKTVTFTTDDGSDTLITVEGATFVRRPYSGGAQVYLGWKLGSGSVKIHSMQKGTITIS